MTPHPIPGALKPHISLNVRDVDRSVDFYRRLFGVDPRKHYRSESTPHAPLHDDQRAASARTRAGYAKFDLSEPPLNLALNEVDLPGGGALSHLGIQVASTDDVLAIKLRLEREGLKARDEMQVACCYARQDKTWVADPDGNEWEFFVVLEDLSPDAVQPASCCGAAD